MRSPMKTFSASAFDVSFFPFFFEFFPDLASAAGYAVSLHNSNSWASSSACSLLPGQPLSASIAVPWSRRGSGGGGGAVVFQAFFVAPVEKSELVGVGFLSLLAFPFPCPFARG